MVGSDPDIPASVRIYKSPDSPTFATRNAGTAMPPGAECRPWAAVLRCVDCPPVGGDTICGEHGLVEAYDRACPSHVKNQHQPPCAPATASKASFGASMPIEKQAGAESAVPRAEHPVVRTHPRRREGFVCQLLHHPQFHQLSHGPRTSATARTSPSGIGPAALLAQPGRHSRIPGPWHWQPGDVAMWDTTAARSTTP
jgi:taurine dioxygenase